MRGPLINICKNHEQPFMHSGAECPWCKFVSEMGEKLRFEYQRGFADGVKAADAEYLKAKKEVPHDTGRVPDTSIRGVQDGVQVRGAQEGGGADEGDRAAETKNSRTGGKK